MSCIYSAGQYDDAYTPKRLGNWTAPDAAKQRPAVCEPAAASSATMASASPALLPPRKGRTRFIADDTGHVLPGVTKTGSAFRTRLTVVETSPPRWPQPNVALAAAPAATMGYKGITTDYLPRSTTVVQTVEGVPGVHEAKYT